MAEGGPRAKKGTGLPQPDAVERTVLDLLGTGQAFTFHGSKCTDKGLPRWQYAAPHIRTLLRSQRDNRSLKMPNPKTCIDCGQEYDGRKKLCPHCAKQDSTAYDEANKLIKKMLDLGKQGHSSDRRKDGRLSSS